jgi:hypothetical protein
MRGRLVIASALGGLVEVGGRARNVCSPGDVEALPACMSAVIAYPEWIAARGTRLEDARSARSDTHGC